jgi:hypothetical protein
LSGVKDVMLKDSAAHCNAGFFPPIVVAFGYLDYHKQQTKENLKQPRATQGQPNKIDGCFWLFWLFGLPQATN